MLMTTISSWRIRPNVAAAGLMWDYVHFWYFGGQSVWVMDLQDCSSAAGQGPPCWGWCVRTWTMPPPRSASGAAPEANLHMWRTWRTVWGRGITVQYSSTVCFQPTSVSKHVSNFPQIFPQKKLLPTTKCFLFFALAVCCHHAHSGQITHVTCLTHFHICVHVLCPFCNCLIHFYIATNFSKLSSNAPCIHVLSCCDHSHIAEPSVLPCNQTATNCVCVLSNAAVCS